MFEKPYIDIVVYYSTLKGLSEDPYIKALALANEYGGVEGSSFLYGDARHDRNFIFVFFDLKDAAGFVERVKNYPSVVSVEGYCRF